MNDVQRLIVWMNVKDDDDDDKEEEKGVCFFPKQTQEKPFLSHTTYVVNIICT